MALFETDVLMTGDDSFARQLRGAIASELDATNLYEKLAARHPEYADKLLEIMKDEMEHSGKLLAILTSVCPEQEVSMSRGIDGE